ncbi:methionine--tRNA ligase [Acinetobacter qingfengensis]|uniref:Methionine--tRNA ligase n=1 Tax=Acinetobacter qingfengensis TaxID=1262585 RepID=A0A1E7QXC1_9GAMM|nr:methionine--tRNA ligase [Acinetobacter qingfengensis]KAA8731606.1 methionine--tRNA ligase [Acinetobacter qingfengensis]OEY91710.1 methionine--tRNA ligase [Acinetobacter qingfengensis]
MSARKILVTNALPYANGPIHMGHLLGYIQADIWVRAMRAMGHDVIYVCADDAHGTAIMLRAEANGITPEQQIANVQQEHERDFAGFGISFDHYDSTHSTTNKARSEYIYLKNRQAGHIAVRPVHQLFDPEKQMFLSDRFIKGTCPKCKADDQYGDSCEVCGTTYNATELLNPHSTLSGATPVEKSSDHYFFKLPNFTEYLQKWTRDQGRLPVSIANKLDEWFEAGLADWDISRDAPYFGFEIPDAPNKYFYVWVDAPIGYMSSFENYIQTKRPELNFDDYWKKDSSHEIYHFIGKDIVYFHALFWPAMLAGAGYRTPTGLFVNGFLTVNGQKMSKSRGTFIKAETYLQHLNPEYLRYYFASKLSDKVEDSDLNLDDFIQKVNSDLVGKVVNIASRCAKFINTKFDHQLSAQCAEAELVKSFIDAGDSIASAYEDREFSAAIREIMSLADKANQYIDEKKPWALAKQEGTEQQVHEVCSVGINLFRQLVIYLSPVLPKLANEVQAFLQLEKFDFASRKTILLNHEIAQFQPLMQRVDKKAVDAMVEASKDSLAAPVAVPVKAAKKKEKAVEKPTSTIESDVISIDDVLKVDLRVAQVLDANIVEGSDKLLQLTLDAGEAEPRNVFSGIRSQYSPEDLKGKLVVLVANLAPRKMRFGISNGMVLCAGNDERLSIISPESGAKPGDKVS